VYTLVEAGTDTKAYDGTPFAGHISQIADRKIHRLTTRSSRLMISHAKLIAWAISRNGYGLARRSSISFIRLTLRLKGDVIAH
jgi:hypothetical protein